MAGSTTPVWSGFDLRWALLVLPAALVIGWGIGQLPTPERTSAVVNTPADDGTAATTSTSLPATVVADPARRGPARAPRDPGTAPAERPLPGKLAFRNESSRWTTLELALAESERNGKPVMIDFNADWCPPCRRMKQEVFEQDAHAASVQTAVIPVSIVDRKREDGENPSGIEELQRRYRIDAFPTLIVFSPATGRVMRTKGYRDAEATVAWITGAAKSVR